MIITVHNRQLEGTRKWLRWEEVHAEGVSLIYDPEEGTTFYEVRRNGSYAEVDVDVDFLRKVRAAAEECQRQLQQQRTMSWWRRLWGRRRAYKIRYAFHCLNGVLLHVG